MAYREREVRFIRINGRVVPIKKRKIDGVAALGGAAAISTGAGIYAAESVKKSNFAYARSANLRGASKLVISKKAPAYMKLVRDSAEFRIAGKKLARHGFGALAFGVSTASALATLGVHKLSNKNTPEETKMAKSAAISGLITAAGLGVFGRKAKLGSLVKMARKANAKKPVSELFGLWSNQGVKRTAATIKKYSKTAYKGPKPKPKDAYRGTQQDLFGHSPKKFDIKNLLKKNK